MSAAVSSGRRALALCSAILSGVCGVATAGCGGGEVQGDRPATGAGPQITTAAPGAVASPKPDRTRAPPDRLTPQERRRARRRLKQLREEARKPPPGVIEDSGVIP